MLKFVSVGHLRHELSSETRDSSCPGGFFVPNDKQTHRCPNRNAEGDFESRITWLRTNPLPKALWPPDYLDPPDQLKENVFSIL